MPNAYDSRGLNGSELIQKIKFFSELGVQKQGAILTYNTNFHLKESNFILYWLESY